MKNKKLLMIVLIIVAFINAGCFSMFATKPTPINFSYAESNNRNETASISFIRDGKKGVRLVDLDGATIPSPAEGTVWDSDILFPAGKPLNIRVYVYWNEDQYGERRRGIFTCPPLEAGKSYQLHFNGNLKGGTLTLTGANSSAFNRDVVYMQQIPPPPK